MTQPQDMRSRAPRRRGSDAADWDADYDHPSHGRYGSYHNDTDAGYDDDVRDRAPRGPSGRIRQPDRRTNPTNSSWSRRHPIILNLIYIVVCAVAAGWIIMWFLDFWTFHGQEVAVPDFKGQQYSAAVATAEGAHIQPVLADSVFDTSARPGTVVEQVPIAGARIKRGGMAYLTVVAFSPKMVTVPDFYNVSARQARSMFEGLGITSILEAPVPSEYEDLVLGARFNGVSLRPGARIPVSAVVTLEVGSVVDAEAPDSTATDGLDAAIDDVFEELNID